MEIKIKKIDELVSTLHLGRKVNEYMIYLSIGDVNISAYNEFGESAKLYRVVELLKEYPSILQVYMGETNTN